MIIILLNVKAVTANEFPAEEKDWLLFSQTTGHLLKTGKSQQLSSQLLDDDYITAPTTTESRPFTTKAKLLTSTVVTMILTLRLSHITGEQKVLCIHYMCATLCTVLASVSK